MKNRVVFLTLLAIIAGCRENPTYPPLSERAMKVKTTRVQLADENQPMKYSGTVEASQVIPLNFRTAGTVETILVDVGDEVRKGQVLATLDDADLQNIYNTMLVKYKQAEDAYNRLKLVYDSGSLPEIKWVEMKSDYDQAKSALELAQSNLEKCKLTAPVNGIIGRRNIEPGQSSISLAMAPLELVRIDNVLVKVSVPENEINKISGGQVATAMVAALGGKIFTGEVTHISPVAEMISRTYTVKISVNNPDRDLKPGMVCDVSLAQGPADNLLVVPNKAVSRDSGENTFVYVVNSGDMTVKKQAVGVGRYVDTGIEITSGLAEGQVIVCEGMEKLYDNCKIGL